MNTPLSVCVHVHTFHRHSEFLTTKDLKQGETRHLPNQTIFKRGLFPHHELWQESLGSSMQPRLLSLSVYRGGVYVESQERVL